MKSKHKKFIEFSITFLSLCAVAAINYSIIHNVFIFVILAVLIAHELGHYVMAKRVGAQPRLPVFLPIPFLLIAATKVQRTDRHARRKIAFAGPLAGAMTALLLLIGAIIAGATMSTVIALALLFITEIVFNFFGSDGKRFRAA